MTESQEVAVLLEGNQPAPQPAPQPVPPPFDPAQLMQIKQALCDKLQKLYMQFVGEIANFPVFKPSQQEAFKFFDTGFLWYRSAIENMQVVVPVPVDRSDAPKESPKESKESA